MIGVMSSRFLLSLTSLVGSMMIARHSSLSTSSSSFLHAKSMGFAGCLNTSLLHYLSFLDQSSSLTSSSSSLCLNAAKECSTTSSNHAFAFKSLLFTLLFQSNSTSFSSTSSCQFLCSHSCDSLSESNDSLSANSCHIRLFLCDLLLCANLLNRLLLCPHFLSRTFTLDDSRLSNRFLFNDTTLLSTSAWSSTSLSFDDSLLLPDHFSGLSTSSFSDGTSLCHGVCLGINLN